MILLGRRQFLRHATGLLTLPVLPSLLPRRARAAASAAAGAPRAPAMFIFHAPCGFTVATFTPISEGADFPLSPSLMPFAELKEHILVLSNVANRAAIESPATPDSGKHSQGMASLFTGARLVMDTPGIQVGISVDQRFAAAQALQTPTASMQLTVDMHGDCDARYPCPYITTISYADTTTPLPPQGNLRAAFDASIGGMTTPEAIARQTVLRQNRRSILDQVLGQAQALKPRLGALDRQKLEQYFTSVRGLEAQLSVDPKKACPASTPAEIAQSDFAKSYPAMMDFMVLALQCDVTRTLSFSFGPGHSGHFYGFLPGVRDVHHGLSHHNGDPDKLAQLTIIDTWQMSIIARFVAGLKAVEEEGGTLLDRTLMAMSSELADGAAHDYGNLAVLVAGGGGGVITGGRHVRVGSPGQPEDIAKLWLSMLRGLGVEVPVFGGFGQTQSMQGLVA